MGSIANLIRRNTGKEQLKEIAPQREAARANVANSASALPMYNARIAADKAAQDQENFGVTSSDTQELVNVNNPEQYIQARKYGGRYYGADNQELDPTQWKESTRSSSSLGGRGSSSRYLFPTMKDPYGNEIIGQADKQNGTLNPFQFLDGTPYDAEKAKMLGGEKAAQSGLETTADAQATANVAAVEEAYKAGAMQSKAMGEVDKALDALVNQNANTGYIASMLPNIQSAAIQLKNAQDQLALFEIGKYAFGALSEAEGKWLKDTVIPTSMEEDQLIPWLQNKREGMRRMIKANEMEQKMRAAGFVPTRDEIRAVLLQDGYTFED
jgi:hypothetical protein